MKTKTQQNTQENALAWYDKLVASVPGVERKGVKLPYTSANGNMFSFLSESGSLALRLPAEEREAFLKKHKTTLVEAHGALMKEYVSVPEKLLKNTEALKPYLELSYAYAKSLQPKSPKKAKAASPKKPRPNKSNS